MGILTEIIMKSYYMLCNSLWQRIWKHKTIHYIILYIMFYNILLTQSWWRLDENKILETLRIILLKFYSVLTQPKMRGSCKYLMFLQIKTAAQYTLYWPTTQLLCCNSRIYCYNFFMIPQINQTIHRHRHFLKLGKL